jgi:hypothetical protein
LYKGCRRCRRGSNLVFELCYGEERLAALLWGRVGFVTVGWVVRLGHVRGWMFMFGVVVGGEPHSWVLAQHHLDHTLFSMQNLVGWS